ncbi:protein NO VEIN domain-containing protein [Aliiroseovarius sp. CAU 1755]
MSGEEWSDWENDAIVADYFSMLTDELSGTRYNKSAHNRSLQELIGRSKGSIEFKHQNISAILKGLSETWINGYKPAFNFQKSLEDAVVRCLEQHGGWLTLRTTPQIEASEPPGAIWISTPPTMQNTPPPDELAQMLAVARKFDVAGRDERNRTLGKAGEERVLHHERAILASAGRHDLAKKVRWVSQVDGDGAGYDISSFTPEGQSRLIEVKTTNGWERTPFHISRNELAIAEDNRDRWTLLRLWNFSRNVKAFELRPPLEAHVTLTATSYQASLH